MFRNQLFFQMFFTAGFAAVLASFVIYTTVQLQLESEFQHKAERSLAAQLNFARVLGRERLTTGEMPVDSEWTSRLEDDDTRLTIIDIDGAVVFDSRRDVAELDNHKNRPEILSAAKRGEGEATRFSRSLNADLLYKAVRVDDPQGNPIGFVRLSSAVRLINEELDNLRSQLLFVIAVTLVALFVICFLLSRRFYQPISAATHYAKQIANGNYGLRLPGLGTDEVAMLQRSLNELARKTEDRLVRIVESRNQVTAILSGLNEGVVALDREENIAHINDAAMKLLGIENNVLGRKVWETIRVPRIQDMLESVLNGRREQDHVILLGNKSLELAILTMLADDGTIDGVILVFRDVTERRQLDKMRSDFVANASHELKTPLAAIKGMTETIIDDPSMPKETQSLFLERVLAQTNRLNKIVLDLMQLSRFEGYREQQLSRSRVDLIRECRQVFAALSLVSNEEDISLELNTELTQLFVFAEQEAMSQVMSNLIENAIKYSPAGATVKIYLGIENNMAVFRVQDEGIGISPENQARVFERFYRVDTARSRELGGTGLGLSIVKHIAESHEGLVEVQSELGEGSTFTFKVPLAD